MVCQQCNNQPATLHVAKISNGNKLEIHLCEQCAKEEGELFFQSSKQGFSVHHLLSGLLHAGILSPEKSFSRYVEGANLACDKCKMTYGQFLKVGQVGCSHCYQVFNEPLTPILKRLHGGNECHVGKIPKRTGGSIHLKKEINQLRAVLQAQVNKEEFEEAAITRDRIKEIESSLHDQGEES